MVTKDANVDTNTYDNVSQFQVPMDNVFAMKAKKGSKKLSLEIIQKLRVKDLLIDYTNDVIKYAKSFTFT